MIQCIAQGSKISRALKYVLELAKQIWYNINKSINNNCENHVDRVNQVIQLHLENKEILHDK